MDKAQKKALLEEYKNKQREMGIISFFCKETGEEFVGISTNIKADFNSNRMKLNTATHPNKHFLELWKTYKEEGFEFRILQEMEDKDSAKDYIKELENLRDKYLSENEKSTKIWK